MTIPVILSLRGTQSYAQQEPEVIELITEGTLEQHGDEWELTYEESELTGLAGVTTRFRIAPDCVVLTRSGALDSQMIFREGVTHDSLYQADFGALMVSVCAQKVDCAITPAGGTVTLLYSIGIEQTAAGFIEYHLAIKPKK